jgi:hypothetical protein
VVLAAAVPNGKSAKKLPHAHAESCQGLESRVKLLYPS